MRCARGQLSLPDRTGPGSLFATFLANFVLICDSYHRRFASKPVNGSRFYELCTSDPDPVRIRTVDGIRRIPGCTAGPTRTRPRSWDCRVTDWLLPTVSTRPIGGVGTVSVDSGLASLIFNGDSFPRPFTRLMTQIPSYRVLVVTSSYRVAG